MVALALLARGAMAAAADAPTAFVLSVAGRATAQRQGAKTQRVLVKGDRLAGGDTVATGPRSRALLKFTDGSTADLQADTQIRLTPGWRPGAARKNPWDIVRGKVRFGWPVQKPIRKSR